MARFYLLPAYTQPLMIEIDSLINSNLFNRGMFKLFTFTLKKNAVDRRESRSLVR